MRTLREHSRTTHPAATPSRGDFWLYCVRTAGASRARATRKKVPHSIDAYAIDELFVDQKWRCAVSGVELNPPKTATGFRVDPLGPSLDRIIPHLGYVPGNLRIVSNIVNIAMNEWGLEKLMEAIAAIALAQLERT